jgi:hypothetical protein
MNNTLRLKNSLAQLNTTEEIGKDTLNELQIQRESLQNVKNNIIQTNSELKYSNTLLNRMLQWFRR